MKQYYDILILFDIGKPVSRLQMLNTGAITKRVRYTDEDIRILAEELNYIQKIGENEFKEPLYIITPAGKHYRDN